MFQLLEQNALSVTFLPIKHFILTFSTFAKMHSMTLAHIKIEGTLKILTSEKAGCDFRFQALPMH